MFAAAHEKRSARLRGWLSGWLTLVVAGLASAQESKLPVLLEENFSQGADRWEPTDPTAWKVTQLPDGNAIYQHFKQSKYKGPHRSPINYSLVKDLIVSDFQIDAKLQSTVKEYGHRDLCLFFGYQDPGHFYYVHLGKKTDDHANQIFIVNGADRTKISLKTTPGTDWTDNWHKVRITRNATSGRIEVFFDNLDVPVMVAEDRTFPWGRVGIGTFDDTGNWDDFVLRGQRTERPK